MNINRHCRRIRCYLLGRFFDIYLDIRFCLDAYILVDSVELEQLEKASRFRLKSENIEDFAEFCSKFEDQERYFERMKLHSIRCRSFSFGHA